jgi:DNA-binding NtrC family response regulator
LENTLEYIVNLEIGDLVTISSLPSTIRGNRVNEAPQLQIQPANQTSVPQPPFSELSLEKTEEHLIVQAIQRFGKSTEGKRKAAEFLGISVATLYRRLKKMNRSHFFS